MIKDLIKVIGVGTNQNGKCAVAWDYEKDDTLTIKGDLAFGYYERTESGTYTPIKDIEAYIANKDLIDAWEAHRNFL